MTRSLYTSGGGSGSASIPSGLEVTKTNSNVSTLPIGTPTYADGNDTVDAAQADALTTASVIGLCKADIPTATEGAIVANGEVEATTGEWDTITGGSGGLVAGTIYYLDPTTPGMLTVTAPSTVGQYIVQIGTAVSATKMNVEISRPLLVTATTIPSTLETTKTNAHGGDIVICQPVKSNGNDTVDLPQADALANAKVIGLSKETFSDTTSGTIVTDGELVATTGEWDTVTGGAGGLTAGAIYYLHPTNVGELTTTKPTTAGQVVVAVGTAVSTTKMNVEISTPEVVVVPSIASTALETTMTNNTGGDITICEVVIVEPATDDHVNFAQGNSLANSQVLGLAKATFGDLEEGTIVTHGEIEALTTDWDNITGDSGGLTAGSIYYLDTVTPGAITKTAPTAGGDFLVRLGVAQSATKLNLNINEPIEL